MNNVLYIYILTYHFANAKYACGVDLQIDANVADNGVVAELASFHSSKVVR